MEQDLDTSGAVASAEAFAPDAAAVRRSQLSDFMRFCETRSGCTFDSSAAFHDFSVADFRRFWALFLSWSALLHEGAAAPVCTHDRPEHASFFPRLRLSYVENLLRGDPERVAVIGLHADRPPQRLTRAELGARVRAVAHGLADLGLAAGDRAAAVAGNNVELVVAGLASTALGATFSSTAPDMGAPALLSRLEQVAPKVLFANLDGRVPELARALPSLTAVVALDNGPAPDGLRVPVVRLSDLARREVDTRPWERFPFNHPLFVLFTSGTTGPPKCIVHGAGGTLLEHLKEHRLHVDLRPDDTLFFHTSAAWMMWNWQLSALAAGSTIVLYDGPVAGPETLWRLVADERVTVFGTSPPYLQLCEDRGYSPRREIGLRSLRTLLSTGSVLHDWQYDWVAANVGRLPVQSISGGTDIVGCFVLGSPNLPVRRGRIQCRSLGLDVQALGSSPGELVCRNPFPSRPLGFLGDDGRRFHDTYFRANPGVWTHGDVIDFDDDGQARIHGRSDGVVNIQGVRVGPTDIYRALRRIREVRDALAVERHSSTVRGQSELALLVVLRDGAVLDGRLTVRIRREIARCASALHVPALVVAVPELPRTFSGKRSERAAADAVNGAAATNVDALANPGSLAAIEAAVASAVSTAHVAGRRGTDGSTEDRLRSLWERVLGVAPLRPDDDFFDLGGTSLAAVRLLHALHDELGADLPLSTLIHAPTTAAMAAVLDGPAEGRAPPLLLLRPGTADRPLFVVHSIWGDALALRPLAHAFAGDRPVYGIQARGIDPSAEPQTRVEDMAESYVAAIRSVQPRGPYAIVGYSFGGLVAFEMARSLDARGEDVEWLGLLDARVHHRCLGPVARRRFLAGRSLRALRARAGASVGRHPGWSTPAPPPLLERTLHANAAAFDAYRPRPYSGRATFVRAARGPSGADLCDPLPVWRRVVEGGLSVERVAAGHDELLSEPHVRVVARRLEARLY